MPKAIVIDISGNPRLKELSTLADYQREVGGYIELLRFPKTSAAAYINEDGKQLNLPRNRKATEMCLYFGYRFFDGDYISGNMIIVGASDENGEVTDVSHEIQALIMSAIN